MKKLADQIALVTGASRGAGKGIAAVLGEAGATVYVTGRSRRGKPTTENLPGTIEDTAELVTARGGRGIAVYCDHSNEDDIQTLVNQIERETGRLDVLVNNAWGGYEHYEESPFDAPFWKQPTRHWDGMFTAGVRATLLTTREAVRLMLAHQKGLIINLVAWDHDKYLMNVFYDTAKHAINRITFGTSQELKPYSIAVLSVAPGFMRTERVRAVVEKHEGFDWTQTESPEYVGRVIAALAGDPLVYSRSGKVFMAGELAAEYHLTDIDGRYVPPFVIPEKTES